MRRLNVIALMLSLVVLGALAAFPAISEAQRPVAIIAPEEARDQLELATRASAEAQERAARFASKAEEASQEADRAANEAAALAARIQRTEAEIAAAQARYSLAQIERARLARRLANRREPLVRLTAALQTNARRPLALSALQPGSLKDLVYVRAVLDSAVPEVRTRTAALREELERGRSLERSARRSLTALRDAESELEQRRIDLAALEARARNDSRAARTAAVREEERALALAEDARDLDNLIARLGENAERRQALAALPGPVLRSDASEGQNRPATIPANAIEPAPVATGAPSDFQLPVQGRTITGYGERRSSGLRARGVELSPAAGAQVVAPASGRVAFSGPYEGFGRIVIIEHAGGWTSLVTGLARTDVKVGQEVIGGAPMGVAGSKGSVVGIELRESGEPVNPLDYLR
jgi:septal ring factor EnvC (AmiA/AmiB activator)